MSTSTVTGNCRICKTECSTRCGHCRKAYYCSATCQQKDRKSHKKYECFPCELIEEMDTELDAHGSEVTSSHVRPLQYWITTREVKENELLFSETSLVSGPCKTMPPSYAGRYDYIPICLACHKILNSRRYNSCQRCKWPVCDTQCQDDGRHSNQECGYLQLAGLVPRKLMEEYEMICIVRTLLIKSKVPQKWHSQVMKMKPTGPNPTYDDPEELRMEQWNQECQFKVFRDMMGLVHVTNAEIVHVTKLWTDLSIKVLGSADISQSDLVFKSILVAHSCVINTKNWTHTYPDGKQVFNYYATMQLPVGTKLSNSGVYGNVMLGTWARREELADQCGFWCKCERCRDPTEMGTYMSAILCTNHTSEQDPSYIVPVSPLDQDSPWKCLDSCGRTLTLKKVNQILKPIKLKMKSFMKRSVQQKFEGLYRNVTPLPEIEAEDYALIVQMESYDQELEKILHPNHYLKFQLRKQILFGMNLIASGLTRGILANDIFKHRSMRLQVLDRMYDIAKHCSTLANGILPGLSLFRGKVLYFLAMSRWAFIIENATEGGSFEKTEKAKNEAENATKLVCQIFEDSGELGPPEHYMLVLNLQATKEIAYALLVNNPTFRSLIE